MLGRGKEQQGIRLEDIEAVKIARFGEIERFALNSELGTPAFLAMSDTAAKQDLDSDVEKLRKNTFATRIMIDCAVAEQAAIRETIRIREDTVPGYSSAKSSISELINHAVDAESDLIYSNRSKGEKIPQSLDDRKNARTNVVGFVNRLAQSIRSGRKIESIYS